MQTVAVYASLFGLMLWSWGRSVGLLVPALAANFVATAAVGQWVRTAPTQDVCMIMCDLAMIYILRSNCSGHRAYFVGLIAVAGMVWRTANIGGMAINPWLYAATLNAAFAAQLLIAGGAGDGLGAWLDDRLGRLFPRFAGLLRHVAG
jgi:hypothetical protein